MKQDHRKAAFITILVICAAVMSLVASRDPCRLPMVKHALADAQATSCLEFWINRYQTLIGALAAVLAAVIAYVAVRQQTDITRLQILREKLSRLHNLARRSSRLHRAAQIFGDNEMLQSMIPVFEADEVFRKALLEKKASQIAGLGTAWEEFDDLALSTPTSDILFNTIAALRGVTSNRISLGDGLASFMDLSPRSKMTGAPPGVIEWYMKSCQENDVRWTEAYEAFRSALSDEIDKTVATISRLTAEENV